MSVRVAQWRRGLVASVFWRDDVGLMRWDAASICSFGGMLRAGAPMLVSLAALATSGCASRANTRTAAVPPCRAAKNAKQLHESAKKALGDGNVYAKLTPILPVEWAIGRTSCVSCQRQIGMSASLPNRNVRSGAALKCPRWALPRRTEQL